MSDGITDMMIEQDRITERLKVLQDILIEYLPSLSRWTKVTVYGPGDDLPREIKGALLEDPAGFAFIFWNGRKSKYNHHEYEFKQFPIENIETEIARFRSRVYKGVTDKYK